MSRTEFSKKVKAAAAVRCLGDCESCGIRIRIGGFHYDHIKPDGLGGKATLANCQVLCLPCHKAKTHTEDNPRMQKADRVKKKIAWGIKSTAHPMPHGKNSPTKRKMDGTIVDRRTGKPKG